MSHGPGLYSIEHVHQWCLSGNMKLWIAWDDENRKIVAAAVTEILKYPLKTVVSIPLIGGSRWQDWWNMHKTIFADAKAKYGCVEMHGYARDGWLRPCLKDGWEKVYTFVRKQS